MLTADRLSRSFDGSRRRTVDGVIVGLARADAIILATNDHSRIVRVPGDRVACIALAGNQMAVDRARKLIEQDLQSLMTLAADSHSSHDAQRQLIRSVAIALAVGHAASVVDLGAPLELGGMLALAEPPTLIVHHSGMHFAAIERTQDMGANLIGPRPNASWLLERCYSPFASVEALVRLGLAAVTQTTALHPDIAQDPRAVVIDTQGIHHVTDQSPLEQVEAAISPLEMLFS